MKPGRALLVIVVAAAIGSTSLAHASTLKGRYRILGFEGCGGGVCYSVRVVDATYSLDGVKTEQRRWVVDSDASQLSDTALFANRDLSFRATKARGSILKATAGWTNRVYSLTCATPGSGDWAQRCTDRSERATADGQVSSAPTAVRNRVECEGCTIGDLECVFTKDSAELARGAGQYLAGTYRSSQSDPFPSLQCGSDIFPTIPVLPPSVR